MKKFVAFACLLAAGTANAATSVIDAYEISGSGGAYFGAPYITTLAQSFSLPRAGRLQSFEFRYASHVGPGPILRAYVYQWAGTAVGPQLFASGTIRLADGTPINATWLDHQIGLGNTLVGPGSYAVILSNYGLDSTGLNSLSLSFSNNFYPGGMAVSAAPAQTFEQTVSGSWSAPSTSDLTFRLTYGAVPEPASWAMQIAGFALAGAVMRRRRVRLA